MVALLVDVNLEGQAQRIDWRLGSTEWQEWRDDLDVHFLHFKDVGLDRDAKDDAVWRLCQQNGYFLLTANRNSESDDSLEATIRREGQADSLPVFALSDADRVNQSAAYLEDVVAKLLEYLLNEPSYRGAGRLYLP